MNYKSGFFDLGFEEFLRRLFDPPPKINPHSLKWVKFVRYLKSGVLCLVMDKSLENNLFLKRFENSGRNAVLPGLGLAKAEAEAERSLYISMLALVWRGWAEAWCGVARLAWIGFERNLYISMLGLFWVGRLGGLVGLVWLGLAWRGWRGLFWVGLDGKQSICTYAWPGLVSGGVGSLGGVACG